MQAIITCQLKIKQKTYSERLELYSSQQKLYILTYLAKKLFLALWSFWGGYNQAFVYSLYSRNRTIMYWFKRLPVTWQWISWLLSTLRLFTGGCDALTPHSVSSQPHLSLRLCPVTPSAFALSVQDGHLSRVSSQPVLSVFPLAPILPC